jgi:hypothetical protein
MLVACINRVFDALDAFFPNCNGGDIVSLKLNVPPP